MDRKILNDIEGEYIRQRNLERYAKTRELIRPRTNIWSIFLFFAIGIGLIAAFYALFPFGFCNTVQIIFANFIFWILFLETYAKFLCISSVKCYQHYAKEDTRRRCLCVPTCSQYAIAVLKKRELLFALFKIYKRLFRTCKGELYIIDKPYKGYEVPQGVK